MIISTTNIVSSALITVSPESPTQDINVISDGDYSSVYTDSLSTSTSITLDFGSSTNIGYLAIGGSNITKKDRIVIKSIDASERVRLVDVNLNPITDVNGLYITLQSENTIDDDLLSLNESNVIMYKIDNPSVQRLEITVYGSGTLSIADVAAGDYYEVPNSGEQGGYNRPWSVPNVKSRSASNLQNSPISMAYESRALKAKLVVPNSLMVDFDAWYNMTLFASSNTFYILEDDNKFHSYACFNAAVDMTKAHGQTRKLGVSSMSFNAYAKSTEAILV